MKNSVQKLSVVILNFNSGNFLLNCLKSLDKISGEANLDIWVGDNASSDDSLKKAKEKFPSINYIENSENYGFTKGNNILLKHVKAEYILILNPDSKVLPGTIRRMIEYMEDNQNVGAASCRVERENGQIDWASHRGIPTPWASFKYYFLKDDSSYHLTNRNMDLPHEVDSITGAFFLTRKNILDQVGLFDEEYFMYGEDLDLCFRIKRAGFKIMYVPDVKIIHYKGVSSGIKKDSGHITTANLESKKRSINAFYEAMIIFYRKNLQKSYPFFVNWLVYLGINLKWIMAKRKLHV